MIFLFSVLLNGATGTRIAKDRERWRTLAEGYFCSGRTQPGTEENRIEYIVLLSEQSTVRLSFKQKKVFPYHYACLLALLHM